MCYLPLSGAGVFSANEEEFQNFVVLLMAGIGIFIVKYAYEIPANAIYVCTSQCDTCIDIL